MKTSRLILYFHAKVEGEPVIDPDEAEEYKWVELSELKEIENKEGALTYFFENFDLEII